MAATERGMKHIQDNVHGSIQVSETCMKIIDTPIFKRLKRLKQLGVAHHVYPGAVHSRFEHSLGAMHIGGRYCRILQQQYPDLISEEDIMAVQVAGLCHDLGHGPFSHLWEGFVRKSDPSSTWTHEQTSLELFDLVLQDAGVQLPDTEVLFIKELINGHDGSEYKGRGKEKWFLYEIVSNKFTDVDVDKWDYFLRDQKGAGTINKGFDYIRLMNNTKIVKIGGVNRLCYAEKMISEVMDMWSMRSYMHKHVYQHKVVKIIERMLLDVLLLADGHMVLSSKGSTFKLSQMHLNQRLYARVVDDWVLGQIRMSEEEGLSAAQQLLERIERRHLYSLIALIRPDNSDQNEGELEEKLQELCKKSFPDCPPDMCVSTICIKMGKNSQVNPVQSCHFFQKQRGAEGILTEKNLLDPRSVQARLEETSPQRFKSTSILILARNPSEIEKASVVAQAFVAGNFGADPTCFSSQ